MTFVPYDENDLAHNELPFAVSEWPQFNTWFSYE
jgi:hypothetical protein